MKELAPSYIELEGNEDVDLNREADWVVNHWLDHGAYEGAWIFPPALPTHAGYWMLPYRKEEAPGR